MWPLLRQKISVQWHHLRYIRCHFDCKSYMQCMMYTSSICLILNDITHVIQHACIPPYRHTTQHSMAHWHSMEWHGTAPHHTVQYSTAQHSAAQALRRTSTSTCSSASKIFYSQIQSHPLCVF